MSAFLTDEEVERLTGYRMFKRQCAQLKRQGIYFTVTRSGVADDKGQPMTRDQLGWGWRKVRASVGLPQYQFRDIRSKAATDADMDGQDAQRLLGHANRSMTERYIRQRRVTDVDPVKRKL